jgi:hypothetical protein
MCEIRCPEREKHARENILEMTLHNGKESVDI